MIGAKLARALKGKTDCCIKGMGGSLMMQEGVEISLDNKPLGVMGLLDVLPNIRRIRNIAKQQLLEIESFKPDILVTIDSFGYHRRIVQRLQQLRGTTKFVHYVAPQVWAHKEKRKFLVKKFFDRVLCILPFEVDIYQSIAMDAKYCGFPAWENLPKPASDALLQECGINPQKPIMLVMPGSRAAEVKRLVKVMAEAATKFAASSDYQIVIPVFPEFRELVAKHFGQSAILIDPTRQDVMTRASIAMIKSGTSSMELVKMAVPHVVCFKSNPLAVAIAKLIIKLKYISLINIVLDKPVVTEFIQSFYADDLVAALNDTLNRKEQIIKDFLALETLFATQEQPSQMAAEYILQLIE